MKFPRIALAFIFLTSACSPAYVMRAGWEESQILFGREPIEDLLDSDETPPEQKRKFQLVLDARSYAKQLGLKPGGSFTKYSDVEREVLLWVLSGSSPVEFNAVTWWFPIVGRIPYKGFFDKEDALEAAKELEEDGFDFFLRPSPAFSTLGWFDDPLLSTVLVFNDVALVNTVIHEILHNTIWIKGSAPFNETLANFVGTVGASEFYELQDHANAELAQTARDQWSDELVFAEFLQKTKIVLENLYKQGRGDEPLSRRQILDQRQILFKQIAKDWETLRSSLRSANYRAAQIKLNNASIVAYRIYLTKPELFDAHFKACGSDLKTFIASMKVFAEKELPQEMDRFEAFAETAATCLAKQKPNDKS